MESVNEMIEAMRKRKMLHLEKCKKVEREQAEDYNNLAKELQTLRVERARCKETIAKNLNALTSNKHTIYKLVHDAKDVSALPISHDAQQYALTFVSDAMEVVKDSQPICDSLRNDYDEAAFDPEALTNEIVKCTESVGQELHRAQSLIMQIETLKTGIQDLQKHDYAPSDDDTELDGSIF